MTLNRMAVPLGFALALAALVGCVGGEGAGDYRLVSQVLTPAGGSAASPASALVTLPHDA